MTKKATTRAVPSGGGVRGQSDYARENKRRQEQWERGFRERFEWIVQQLGGPGKTQEKMHLTTQTFQKVRKGGSRLSFLATLCDVCNVNPAWLLLGSHSETPFRSGANAIVVDPGAAEEVPASQRQPASSRPSRGAGRKRRPTEPADDILDQLVLPTRRQKSPTGTEDERRRK